MTNGKKEIRYFSMFTGVGGFELGLERTSNNLLQQNNGQTIRESKHQTSYQKGECSKHIERTKWKSKSIFTCVGMSEIDKYASELLKQKFPTVKNWGDCTKINPSELPDFDMLCGGFPCQAFSIAGKRKGFQDTRGTLFFEIARILEVKRPKIILLENVKGLLNHEKGETFRVILQTLEELGYDIQWMVLNSKFFGVPQNRERVFIIGSLGTESRPEILPFREINVKDEIEIKRIGHMKGFRRYNQTYDINGGCESLDTSQGGGHQPCIMDLYNKKEHSDRSPALTEPHHNTLRVREGMKIRRLTPIECERLQGFPRNWTEGFSDTQRYKMMGNAVTVNVIMEIAKRLLFITKEE